MRGSRKEGFTLVTGLLLVSAVIFFAGGIRDQAAAEVEKQILPTYGTGKSAGPFSGVTVPHSENPDHTKDSGSLISFSESGSLSNPKHKGISIAQAFPDDPNSSEVEGQTGTSNSSPLVATEDELRQFLSHYLERYTQKDTEGLVALFSRRAAGNRRDGLDEIRREYSDFFNQSKKLRYQLQDMWVEIYQNAADIRARYKLNQVLKTSGNEMIWRGQIHWILARENGALRIRYLADRVEKSFVHRMVAYFPGGPSPGGEGSSTAGASEPGVPAGDGSGGGSAGGGAPGDGGAGDSGDGSGGGGGGEPGDGGDGDDGGDSSGGDDSGDSDSGQGGGHGHGSGGGGHGHGSGGSGHGHGSGGGGHGKR